MIYGNGNRNGRTRGGLEGKRDGEHRSGLNLESDK